MVYSPYIYGTASNYVTGAYTAGYTIDNYTTVASTYYNDVVYSTPVTYEYVGGSGGYIATQGIVNTSYPVLEEATFVPGEINVTGTVGYINTGWLTVENTNLYAWPTASKEDQFKNKLKSNLAIIVKSRVELLPRTDPAELVALETLREVISEAEYRKYMCYGFVLVKGQSGATYQIFRNKSHTKVWDGKMRVL